MDFPDAPWYRCEQASTTLALCLPDPTKKRISTLSTTKQTFNRSLPSRTQPQHKGTLHCLADDCKESSLRSGWRQRERDRKAPRNQSLFGPCATFHSSFSQCDGSMCTCRHRGRSHVRCCREWGRPNDKFDVSHGRASPLTGSPQNCVRRHWAGTEKIRMGRIRRWPGSECRWATQLRPLATPSAQAKWKAVEKKQSTHPVRYVLTRTLCATYYATTNCTLNKYSNKCANFFLAFLIQ